MTRLEEVIEKCKKKDPIAQKELYNLISRKLFGICLRYTGSRQEAEDYFQEAFIRIFENIKSYKGEGPFEAWARKVTVNFILREIQKKNLFRHSLSLETVDGINFSEQDSDRQLHVDELLNFINQLPDSKRIIFNLYAIEGYSHKEISELLKISEGTSKSQLFKAREILIGIYQKHSKAGKIIHGEP